MRVNETSSVVVYRPALAADASALRELFASDPSLEKVDQIAAQLRDLVAIRNPDRRLSIQEADELARDHVRRHGAKISEYGAWVYYPWSRRLVHLLDEQEFVEVRTNRNRHKITQAEQNQLALRRVGVVGLSVGQSVALALSLERGCGELRLADFDRIDLSNLNRIRGGVHSIGLPKVVVAAREIAEADPYLRVLCFPEGITRSTIDAFFFKDGRLDLCVEECDDLGVKLLVREYSRAARIPVLMDTSDRGMIDVERFDLEPQRAALHGMLGDMTSDELEHLSAAEKYAMVLKIIGDTLSDRMRQSLRDIGTNLCTWPQLASAVMHGGGMSADVARRLLLSEPIPSGRYFVDVERLIGGG